jgi:hypothetical protein
MLLRPLDLQVPPLAGTKITGEKVSEPARNRQGENQSMGIEKRISMDSLPLVVRN